MRQRKRQMSFTGGVLSPRAWGRVDLARYINSVAEMQNAIVHPQGGFSNRGGLQYIAACKTHTTVVRLVPFVFNTDQTYVLEFGVGYMRVFRNGAQIESAGSPVEIVTPYTAADIPNLRFAQANDVLTVVVATHAPREVTRTSDTAWAINTIDWTPDISAPTSLSSTLSESPADGLNDEAWAWVVTAVDDDTGEESLPSTKTTKTIPMTAQNSTDDTFGEKNPVNLSWTASTGAGYYNVYRDYDQNSFYKFIGRTENTSFTDPYLSADATRTPPENLTPFDAADKYPSVVSFFQQRRVFGGSNDDPDKIWMTSSGLLSRFAESAIPRDTDSIEFSPASRQQNTVRALIPFRVLLVLTQGAEYTVGKIGEGLTPSNLPIEVQGYDGCANVEPIVVGNTAIFVTNLGRKLRDLSYIFENDSYSGSDLTIMAENLFSAENGYGEISELSYAPEPHGIVWAVMSDGRLLGLTYMKEHEIWGWHSHETEGTFESICSVPEDGEYATYAVVKRTINSATKRYVERLDNRLWSDQREAIFLDSCLSYDGRGDGVETATVSGGNYDVGDVATVTMSASTFADPGSVGAQVWLHSGDETYRMTILSVTSGTVAQVRLERTLPAALQNTATTSYSYAPINFSGLDHLEAEEVAVVSDGADGGDYTVSSGAITLDEPAAVVHVGLAYTSKVKTLPLSVPQAGGLRENWSSLYECHLDLYRSYGFDVYGEFVDHTGSSARIFATVDAQHTETPALIDGVRRLRIEGSWSPTTQVVMEQTRPLPMAIRALTWTADFDE